MDQVGGQADANGATIEAQRLLELLPHRYPFLLVDRITSMRADEFCIGIKNVTFNEPFFQGHFPGRPVMPGVLLLEGMAQSAGALCMHHLGIGKDNTEVFFVTIDKAKFRKTVHPGDVVEYHMTKMTRKRNIWWFQGEARVNGQMVAQAQVSAIINGA
jgi:3-hydroxyacyl-[acyl-carrier-protein] dehydratase